MIDEWGKGDKYWTKTWNPVIGCRKISEGCQNCYAESMTKRFKSLRNNNEDFSPHLVDKTRNPPRDGIVFVGNMTDIFGDWNTNEQVCKWISDLNGSAINLILTKRALRLHRLFPNLARYNRLYGVTAEKQCYLDERYYALANFRYKWLSLELLLEGIKLNNAFLVFILIGLLSVQKAEPIKDLVKLNGLKVLLKNAENQE